LNASLGAAQTHISRENHATRPNSQDAVLMNLIIRSGRPQSAGTVKSSAGLHVQAKLSCKKV